MDRITDKSADNIMNKKELDKKELDKKEARAFIKQTMFAYYETAKKHHCHGIHDPDDRAPCIAVIDRYTTLLVEYINKK